MARWVLDTSVLISWWHGRLPNTRRVVDTASARDAAQTLGELHDEAFIVTPVRVELLCGARDRSELALTRYSLDQFQVLDKGRVLVEDWTEAERLASRIAARKKARDFGDCLIRAIANRFHATVLTFDEQMPSKE
jgi:predicted nucleic acid-binding protein